MPFNRAGHTVFSSPESHKTTVLEFQMQEDERAAHILTCNMLTQHAHTQHMLIHSLTDALTHSVPYTLMCNACSHRFSYVMHDTLSHVLTCSGAHAHTCIHALACTCM